MAHPIQHAPRRLALAVCLFAACAVRAAIPLADPPQDLKNEDGTPEVGLVDPFVPRGAAEDPDMPGTGLTRTAAGELPADFRILAISIPEQGKPSALVRMGEKEDPTLVHEGDQVREPRPIPRGRARAEEDPNARYTFYLYVKTIAPTYIEVYHSKTRPDDTQILRW